MRLGIQILRFNFDGGPPALAETVTRIGEMSEAIGAESLTFADHFFQPLSQFPAEEPVLEGYTSLGYLAARTTKIQLGLMVTGVTYRHPGLLAKVVTTLDILSAGRAELGMGAAWYEREHVALGVPFPPLSERFERLEEALQICLQMWSSDDGPFIGRHYQLAETLCRPAPLSQPHPPVVIGGVGEQKTLRLVALYADLWNAPTLSLSAEGEEIEVMRHKLDLLRRHCDDADRSFDDIALTIAYSGEALHNDHSRFLSTMADFAALGVSRVTAVPMDLRDPVGWIESNCGPLVSRLEELG